VSAIGRSAGESLVGSFSGAEEAEGHVAEAAFDGGGGEVWATVAVAEYGAIDYAREAVAAAVVEGRLEFDGEEEING
jgi:hypothetical protein